MPAYHLPVMRGHYVAGKPTKEIAARLSAHLKYNQYRKLGLQEEKENRFLFTQESDHVQRKDAVHDIMQHTSANAHPHPQQEPQGNRYNKRLLRHVAARENHYKAVDAQRSREAQQRHDNKARPQANVSVNYHKIILSPAEYEHIQDFQQWTRDVMNDLQKRKAMRLHWYAVVQAHPREHTNEPHIHLVLAGAGEDARTGEMKVVRMDKDDYAFLRERGRERGNFAFYQQREQQAHTLDALDTLSTHHQPLERQQKGREAPSLFELERD